ncbi:NAD-dependent epimerase/dehydratase family protein [Nocardia yunnanensis]|uniref:NAD-dependent epimerase/dehydratase family protein n=1 Tax=Nocardia yunnanensis TaxID=2382165 RepID=A0A386Z7U5_9NOCA|nr:NAD(P)H-binding protein [Nocardia yunnanensis]AYF72539.1 NAD-dependent epimerase/dehydratase family protein [Nocardia yunnanensis]
MFLVTGATGTVGRAVIDRLLAADHPVRAITRRPESAGLPASVEVVCADLADPGSLSPALAGVRGVFAATAGTEIPTHDANLAAAAVAAGVERLVKLSSGRAGDEAATDPIPAWHRAGERAVRASGIGWTMVRPMGFMSNALHWAHSVRETGTVRAPFGQGRIAVVDPADIAAVAVAALTEPGHAGEIYTVTGPQPLSPREQTETLAEILGRPLRFEEISPERARAELLRVGVEPAMAAAIMALRATALESFTSVVHPTVEHVTGRSPRTFREWAFDHRNSFTAV